MAGDVATIEDPPTVAANIALGSDFTIGAFDVTTRGPINLTGANTLIMDAGGLPESRILVSHHSGEVAVYPGLEIASAQTAEFALPSAFSKLRLPGGLLGDGGIRKTGLGFLTLDGDNDAWTGPLSIEQGRVILSNGAKLGTSTAGAADGTTILAGGVLALDTLQSGEVGNEYFTLAGGRIEFSGMSNVSDEIREFQGPIHVPAGYEGEFVSQGNFGARGKLRLSGGVTGDSFYFRNGSGYDQTFDDNPVSLTGALTFQNVRSDGQFGQNVILNVQVEADELFVLGRFSPARPPTSNAGVAGGLYFNADAHFGRIKIEDGFIAGTAAVFASDDPVVDIWNGGIDIGIQGVEEVHKWTPQRAMTLVQDDVQYHVHGGILHLSDDDVATGATARIEAAQHATLEVRVESHFDVDIDLNNGLGLPVTGALLSRGGLFGDVQLGDVGSVIQGGGDTQIYGDVSGGALTVFGQPVHIQSDASYTGTTTIGRGGERATLDIGGSIAHSSDIIVNTGGELRAAAPGLHGDANVRLRGGEFTGFGTTGTIANVLLESAHSALQADDDSLVNVGTLTRDDVATVLFRAEGNFNLGDVDAHAAHIFLQTPPSLDHGIIGGWAVAENRDNLNFLQTDFATYTESRGVVPLSPNGRPSQVALAQPTDNVRIVSGQSPLTADVTLNSLVFAGPFNSGERDVDLDGHTLTVASGGIIGWRANSLEVIENGTLTSGINQLFLYEGMEVSANITDGPAGTVDLVIDTSLENVIISGANSYSGATYVRGSEVTFTSEASLPVDTELYVEAAEFHLNFVPQQPVDVGTLYLQQGGGLFGAPVEADRYEVESGLIFAELHGDAEFVKTTPGKLRISGTTGLAPMEHFSGPLYIHDGLVTAELLYGGVGSGTVHLTGGVVEFDPRGTDDGVCNNDFILDGGAVAVYSAELVLAGTVDVQSDSALLTFQASFDAGRYSSQDPYDGTISVVGPTILRNGVTLSKVGLGQLNLDDLHVGADTSIANPVLGVGLRGQIVSNDVNASLNLIASGTGEGYTEFAASLWARQGESLTLLDDGAYFEVGVQGANKQISGGGTIINDLFVADGAYVRPGDTIGSLTAAGNLTLGAAATLSIEMPDPVALPGIGWDLLSVGASLAFAGTEGAPVALELTSLDGGGAVGPLEDFDTHAKYEWMVAAAGSLLGFDPGDVDVDAAAFFDLNAAPSSAHVWLEARGNTLFAVYELVPGPEDGDANSDGVVDGNDYLIWAANFDAMDPPDVIDGPNDGDFNHDGAVNGIDYLTWASNYGAGVVTTPVPEPMSCALLVVGLAAGVTARPRRRKR
ncbi:MAG: hypothetical protein KDA63_00595 [Planctomycetales bacterium]|nr:hypothetical protein [Planctomycetales bacterium]